MEGYGYHNNGEIRFSNVVIYLSQREPPVENYFILSEEMPGFGSFCEDGQCGKACAQLNCPGKIKTEISELVYGNEIVKSLRFSYSAAGKLWLWLGQAFRKNLSLDKKLTLEILPKENVEGYAVILELEISETKETLAAYNITNLLKYRNQWNAIEIPLGADGFDLSWHKLTRPGTLTFVLKTIPLEGNSIKGNLYLKSLTIK